VCDSIAELVESVGLKAEVYASALAFLEAFQPERPGCLVLDHLLVGRANFRLGSSLHAHAGQ
jgi:FixJ family two-component response regulator